MNIADILTGVATAALVGLGAMTVDNQRTNAAQDERLDNLTTATAELGPKLEGLNKELVDARVQVAALNATLKTQKDTHDR